MVCVSRSVSMRAATCAYLCSSELWRMVCNLVQPARLHAVVRCHGDAYSSNTQGLRHAATCKASHCVMVWGVSHKRRASRH